MNNTPLSQPSMDCPSTMQLQSWLDGDLEFPEDVRMHIRTCDRCTQSLGVLSNDESLQLLADLSSRPEMPSYLNEPEFERVRTALNAPSMDDLAFHSAAGGVVPVSTQRADMEATDAEPTTLDSPSVDSLQRRLPSGRFMVDRLIAKGGSGAVYLAYDQGLKREVAIKVLARDSLRERQRFIREARILAELEHPNVVRVFDFGTLSHEGELLQSSDSTSQNRQLYLVMEYVPGGTVGAMRTASRDGDENFQSLAVLLASAADGLAAAHKKSLIHRDVKPGNLLLVADGTSIKVGDFGLARFSDADATQVTRTGDLLGTPVFMSPEQVHSPDNVSASSDIYSLGATIYQLITGIAPFQGGSAAVLRQVIESTPVAPRLINASIPVDLETICLHAMAFEPTARYASMQELASDLRSFSQGELIRAKPSSKMKKAMRFFRRNKLLAAIVATCAILVFLLTVGSVTAAIVFYNQNQQLETAAVNERTAKQSAEDALKTSITAADELLLAVTTETEFLPRAPGSQEVTRKLLLRARDYFRSFLDANAGNPKLQYQLARAHAGLATVAIRVGDRTAVEQETEAALAMIESISDREIEPDQRASLKSDTIVAFANYLIEAGDAKQTIPILEEANATCIEALKTYALQNKGKTPPKELRESNAIAVFAIANALTWVGKREEAIPMLNEAKELFHELLTAEPGNPTYLRNEAACHVSLATNALNQDKASDSKSHLMDALELLNQVDDKDAISLRIRELKIKVLTNLALAERRMGNNVESKMGYESAIAESRRLIELEPSVASHQWNLVVASLNSGGPDMELGNLEPLVERWRATVPVLDKLMSADPSNQRYRQVNAMLQSNIAIILRDMGKLEEAIAPLQTATEILRQQAKQLDNSPEAYLPVALNHYELAATFIQLTRWKEAERELDSSDIIVKEILDKEPTFTPARGHMLDAMHARFQLMTKQGGADAKVMEELALNEIELAREVIASKPDVAEYQVDLPRAMNDRAQTLLDRKQFAAALEVSRESSQLLANIQAKQESIPPDVRTCRKNAILIEARSTIGTLTGPASTEQMAALTTLLEKAAEYGATEDELQSVRELLAGL